MYKKVLKQIEKTEKLEKGSLQRKIPFNLQKDVLGVSKSEKIKKAEKILQNTSTAPQSDIVKINPEHGKAIADAYHNLKHEPDNPKVKEAYNALIGETNQQFHDIMKGGLKISRIEPGMQNPYKNSKELHADIKNNNHLWYFPTEQGFGGGEETLNHPMLQSTGIKHGDKELLANDVFRIVHDINGHHLGGESGFGPTGEHQAYLTHKKMFSPLAQKALATETMGQNSWVNFGPHGEHNTKNPHQTVYADQKAGLLPDEIVNKNWHTDNIKKSEKINKDEAKQILKDYILKKSQEYSNISSEILEKNFKQLLKQGLITLELKDVSHSNQEDIGEVEKDRRFYPIKQSNA
jgi:hypothetical protein